MGATRTVSGSPVAGFDRELPHLEVMLWEIVQEVKILLGLVISVIGIVVTVVSIIVTLISICITNKSIDNKKATASDQD